MIRFQNWLCAWADMIVGLISIITLTYYRPWWDFDLRCYFTKLNLTNKMKRKNI